MNRFPPADRLALVEAQLRQAAKASPDSAEAQFRLGLFLHQLGRVAEAETRYAAALRRAPNHADATNNLALILEGRGKPAEAERLLRRGLERHPGSGTLRCNLARLQMEQDRLEEAAANFTQALELPPVAAAAHCGLGMVRRRQQRAAEAESLFRAALARDPRLGDAHNEIGALLRQSGRTAEAEESFRAALRVQPNLPAAHLNLGALLLEAGRLEEAEAALLRSLQLKPDWNAYYYLGSLYRRAGRAADAEAALRRSVALDRCQDAALDMLGLLLQETKRASEAEENFRRAIALDANDIAVRLHLGHLLWQQRREAEALALVEEVLAQAPDSAEAINLRGVLWETDGVLSSAIACYERAVALAPQDPDPNFNLGCMRLLSGDFAGGWSGYEWRLKTSRAKRDFFAAKPWDGSPLDGKTILLHSEQGLGDTLQFCRYVPLVAARGGTVILAVQPPLVGLLSQLPGVARVIAAGGTLPAADFLMPLASLPRLFTHDFATIPATEGYLRVSEDALARWRTRLPSPAPARRVGLAWAGNPEQAMDRNRSMAFAMLLPLLDIPGIAFCSLQVGPRAGDIAAAGAQARITDLSGEIADFTDTAAALSLLDLVVTVDSSLAHLAGALNRPAWVMLWSLADWRWHLERSDSPWYASLRLFRQSRRGDWADVVEQVAAALRAWSAAPLA